MKIGRLQLIVQFLPAIVIGLLAVGALKSCVGFSEAMHSPQKAIQHVTNYTHDDWQQLNKEIEPLLSHQPGAIPETLWGPSLVRLKPNYVVRANDGIDVILTGGALPLVMVQLKAQETEHPVVNRIVFKVEPRPDVDIWPINHTSH